MSYSFATEAAGALVRSHALKSFRSAESRARSDLTAVLVKSIFLPGAGLVRGELASGSPTSRTSALVESTLAAVAGASLFVACPRARPPPGAADTGPAERASTVAIATAAAPAAPAAAAAGGAAERLERRASKGHSSAWWRGARPNGRAELGRLPPGRLSRSAAMTQHPPSWSDPSRVAGRPAAASPRPIGGQHGRAGAGLVALITGGGASPTGRNEPHQMTAPDSAAIVRSSVATACPSLGSTATRRTRLADLLVGVELPPPHVIPECRTRVRYSEVSPARWQEQAPLRGWLPQAVTWCRLQT